MSKAVDALREKLHIEEKAVLESDEDAHTDDLWQRRMSSQHTFVSEHYPSNKYSREMKALIHQLKKLSHQALEHKE